MAGQALAAETVCSEYSFQRVACCLRGDPCQLTHWTAVLFFVLYLPHLPDLRMPAGPDLASWPCESTLCNWKHLNSYTTTVGYLPNKASIGTCSILAISRLTSPVFTGHWPLCCTGFPTSQTILSPLSPFRLI